MKKIIKLLIEELFSLDDIDLISDDSTTSGQYLEDYSDYVELSKFDYNKSDVLQLVKTHKNIDALKLVFETGEILCKILSDKEYDTKEYFYNIDANDNNIKIVLNRKSKVYTNSEPLCFITCDDISTRTVSIRVNTYPSFNPLVQGFINGITLSLYGFLPNIFEKNINVSNIDIWSQYSEEPSKIKTLVLNANLSYDTKLFTEEDVKKMPTVTTYGKYLLGNKSNVIITQELDWGSLQAIYYYTLQLMMLGVNKKYIRLVNNPNEILRINHKSMEGSDIVNMFYIKHNIPVYNLKVKKTKYHVEFDSQTTKHLSDYLAKLNKDAGFKSGYSYEINPNTPVEQLNGIKYIDIKVSAAGVNKVRFFETGEIHKI